MAGIKYPCFADVKYDGHGTTVIAKNGICQLTTDKIVKTVTLDFPVRDGVYLAEVIYVNGLWDTLKFITDANTHNLNLKFFDILMLDDISVANKDLVTRKELLCSCVHSSKIALTQVCENIQDVNDEFFMITEGGYEGIVVKNFNEPLYAQSWVKMKPKDRITHGNSN